MKVEKKGKLEQELELFWWDLQSYNNEAYVTCKNKSESFYEERIDHGLKKWQSGILYTCTYFFLLVPDSANCMKNIITNSCSKLFVFVKIK